MHVGQSISAIVWRRGLHHLPLLYVLTAHLAVSSLNCSWSPAKLVVYVCGFNAVDTVYPCSLRGRCGSEGLDAVSVTKTVPIKVPGSRIPLGYWTRPLTITCSWGGLTLYSLKDVRLWIEVPSKSVHLKPRVACEFGGSKNTDRHGESQGLVWDIMLNKCNERFCIS